MSHRYILRSIAANEREQWDHFVSEHQCGHLLQSWGWGELKASVGWYPLRLALWDTERDKMLAGAQVLCKGPGYLPLQAGYLAYIPKGPVLDWSQCLPGIDNGLESTRDVLNVSTAKDRASLAPSFLALVDARLRRKGAIALQIELGQEVSATESDGIIDLLRTIQFHPVRAIQPVRTVLLDLSADEETLLGRMKEKWRYNVRLAARKGVQVRLAQTVEDVLAWYELLRITGKRDHFSIHTFDYYLRAWRIFAPRNAAQLFLAEYQGQLLAGIFVGLFARQAIYLYGASGDEQRHLMPNYLLQWEAMRWAKQEGARSYDLWGISETDDEDDALAGVSRFKRGWGGQEVRFAGNYEHSYHPLRMRLARRFLPS